MYTGHQLPCLLVLYSAQDGRGSVKQYKRKELPENPKSVELSMSITLRVYCIYMSNGIILSSILMFISAEYRTCWISVSAVLQLKPV